MGTRVSSFAPKVWLGVLFLVVGVAMLLVTTLFGPPPSNSINWWSLAGALVVLLGLTCIVVGIVSSILHAIWAFVTGQNRNRYHTKIRGVTQFREAVAKARVGDELLFRFELKRNGDIKGVGIHLGRTGEQLGRFSQDRYRGVADQMLRGAVMRAKIKDVTGGGDKETGLNIEVHLVKPGRGPQSSDNVSKFALGDV